MAAKRKITNENNYDETANRVKRQNFERGPVTSWDTSSLCSYLEEEHDLEPSVLATFSDEEIDGKAFIKLTEDRLEKIGIDTMGKRLTIVDIINSLKSTTEVPEQPMSPISTETKVFNDSIHGHIELHPLCVKIIDTPQFQRLRYLRQLGGAYFVFPGASHNRFEHSLGVCHLAGRLVTALRDRQPELNITDQDILCVQIAGLCHDLGHGPFSHMFDGNFIPMAEPKSTWKHEDASVKMFDYLVDDNGLVCEFEKYDLKENDLVFIKEQVAGPLNKNMSQNCWEYRGRGPEKSFLYEVVANKRNGIDVDKWDYFARDCHHLGIKSSVDHYRFIRYARVIKVEGQLQICTRDKEAQNVYDMFWTRHCLHRRAYQHHVSKVIEIMISEAFVKANDHFMVSGKNGPVKLSETIYDMTAFCKLTDHVFHQILFSTDSNLEESRAILQRIEKRDLYKCVGQTQPDNTTISKDQITEIVDEIATIIDQKDILKEFQDWIDSEKALPLHKDDFVVIIANMDYGMKDNNPVENVRFYKKGDQKTAIQIRKDDVSKMLPSTFSEQHIRVYCKKTDPFSLAIANLSFRRWCEARTDMKPAKGGDDPSMYLTPLKLSSSQPSSQGFATPQQSKQNPQQSGSRDMVKSNLFQH